MVRAQVFLFACLRRGAQWGRRGGIGRLSLVLKCVLRTSPNLSPKTDTVSSIRTVSIAYGFHVATTVVPLLAELLFRDFEGGEYAFAV
jgi:hypothetical protein